MGGLIHEINVENNTVLGSSVAQFAPKEARLLPETKIKEIGVKYDYICELGICHVGVRFGIEFTGNGVVSCGSIVNA